MLMQHPFEIAIFKRVNVYDVVCGMILMEQEVCVLTQLAMQEIKPSANRLKA